jgi:hypothetical protein
MVRRMFWFVLGVLAGIYGTAWLKRKATELGERLTLASVIQIVTDASKFLIDKLLELWQKDADVATKPHDESPHS